MLGWLTVQSSEGAAVAPVEGQHKLKKEEIFRKSHAQAITPDSPGSWQSFRFAPPPTEARPISGEEAEALKGLAKQSGELVKSTRKGHKALRKLSENSVQINKEFEKTRRVEGRNEVRMQSFKATSARCLHGLRPEFAKLGQGLQEAEASADQAIAQLMQTL